MTANTTGAAAMIKMRTKVVVAAVAAASLYGGSLYIFTSKAAAAYWQTVQKTRLSNEQNQLNASIGQEQQQIGLDDQAIAELKKNLVSVHSHTQAIQQHTALLNRALGMLKQGKPVSEVVRLIQSGKVPVNLPKVPTVTVQHASVSTPPAVTTVTRASGTKP